MKWAILWMCVLSTVCLGVEPTIVVRNGQLLRDGKPYRGIGVNYYDAFYRTLYKPGDASYEQGFETLESLRIPFVRLMACGFWPGDMKLYQGDKEAYFRKLDAVVRSAEKHHIGLVPSLFWHLPTVPDLVGEPCDQWGNPQSKTCQFMRRYTREVVSRYKDSPAIWIWEFGNEYNLPADLPNAAEHRPWVHTDLGTPSSRSAHDEITHDMFRTALAEFSREVRRIDPDRPITSGNAFPRVSAWHQWKEKSWKGDTPEQFEQMLGGDNPDPMDLLSVHAYYDNVKRVEPGSRAAVRIGKPLFIGEFGVPGPASAENRKKFEELLGEVERSTAPLAALWNFSGDDKEYSVSPTNERRYQLEAVVAANRRLAAERH